MERKLASRHLHIPAQLCTDIHKYIHTYDRQTSRQTYIPMLVLVALHRHGGGVGRRPLDIYIYIYTAIYI